MLESFTSAIESRRGVLKLSAMGAAAITALIFLGGVVLLFSLPNAGAFDARVAELFVQNEALRDGETTRLLEILAQSGTAFSEVLAGYRLVILILLIFAALMLLVALLFLATLLWVSRRIGEMERSGIRVSSLIVSREERKVYLNDMEFQLTEAAIETLSVLAEARMDEDVLSGAEIEAMVSGRSASDCDEASGATRIKRLRDALGNQMVSALLVKTIARRGYMLAIDKDVIRMV